MGWFKDKLINWLGSDIKHISVESELYVAALDGVDYMADFNFLAGSPEQAMSSCTTCYAAIAATSRAIATLPPVVQRRGGSGESRWVTIQDHPLYDLLDYPVGRGRVLPAWTWQHFMETIVAQLETGGNAYLIPSKYGGQISSLLPVRFPNAVSATIDDRGFPTQYWILGEPYTPASIVNIMLANPGSFWDGLSPLEAARPDVAIVRVAKDRQAYNLKNKVGSGLIFKIGSALGATEEQLTTYRENLSTNYRLSSQDGTPLVMGKNTEIAPLPAQDLSTQILEARKLSANEIMQAFQIPGPVLGRYDGAPIQQFKWAVASWWNTSLSPLAGTVYGAINAQAVWPYYGDRTFRIWYDVNDVLIGLVALEAKAAAAQALVNLGYPTNAAAARVDLGMERWPELDKPNTQFTLAGREKPTEDPNPDQQNKDGEEKSDG